MEECFGPDVLPLSEIVVGYGRNREAALAILDWLEERVDVDRTLAVEISAGWWGDGHCSIGDRPRSASEEGTK